MNSDRSDILCIGVDGALYDVAWVKGEGWKEKKDLEAEFDDIVSVQKVNNEEIVVIGLKPDGSPLYNWLGSWFDGQWWVWDETGGSFISVPALASGGSGFRIDFFGIGFDGKLYHRSYASGSWQPPGKTWEILAE